MRDLIRYRLIVALVGVFALVGCGANAPNEDSDGEPESGGETQTGEEQRFPDVVDVTVEETGDRTYTFSVTISSPYDTPERYADGWRIMDADGTVYGEHTLAHDHANEQPFTRTQNDVEIPSEVTEVIVEGRDQEYGYGGETFTVPLP